MSDRKTTSTNFINQSFLETKCALNELIYLLSKRWTTEVLFSVEEGNNRFSSIKEDLKYISDHILAERLRLLEQNKFIAKRLYHDIQPRAEYTITETGKELSALLGNLCSFAEDLDLQTSVEKKEKLQGTEAS